MAKGVHFTVRSKRRSKRKGPGRIVLIVIAIILLAFGLTRMMPGAAIPAMVQTSMGQQEEVKTFFGSTMYMRIISQVIPGLSESITEPASSEVGSVGENALKKVGLSDPRDPKNILATQIPYMTEAGIKAQPLINKPVSGEPAVEEPKIVIPLRRTLNGEGKVLIYHAHTTESFVPTSGKRFTENLDLTVAHLGATLASILTSQYGIPVVHDKTIHDIPRSTSYEMALPTIKGLIADNPDAELVIDLHRDGVARSVTTADLSGGATGRILFVVGSRHPQWQENNQKAIYLHEKLEELSPGISRGVRERPLVYNQNVHPGALLIEVGGHENSLEEVMRTMPILAEALFQLYNSGL
jgi:stage II sporulation protein P